MKATQSTRRHTRESFVHWTLVALVPLVALVVLTLVVLVYALSSSVAQGADGLRRDVPGSDNSYTNESAQVQSVRADEQIILSQIMTDKRAIYAQAGAGRQGAALCAGRVAHRQRTAAQGHAADPARPVNRGSRTNPTLTERFR